MSRALSLLLLLVFASCTNPLELGERRYREGDRLAALERWRSVRGDSPYYDAVKRRISAVEKESEQLVVRYKKRARYYERKGKLAESVLNYRLALKLRPGDRDTLEHVQSLVRTLATMREGARSAYAEAFEAGGLAAARRQLDALRTLDPFDPRLGADERQFDYALQAEVGPLLVRGRRGFSSGNYTSAERAFRSVLELDPQNETALGFLAHMAQVREAEQAPEGSLPVSLDPLQEFEILAKGEYEKARQAEKDGDIFAAIRFDVNALSRKPRTQDKAEIERHLAKLRKDRAPPVENLIQAGQDYYRQEDLEAALEQWENALLVDPNNSEAQRYRDRARRLLDNLERLRPKSEDDMEP